MRKKQEKVSSCIQCEGDAMLEVRKHANELFCVMDQLSLEYGSGLRIGVTDFVRVLIEAEKDQRRLVALLHSTAERRVKEIDSLVSALKFLSDCTKETYSSGVNLSGKAMSIQLTEIFRVAIHRLESLKLADKGLIDGRQPHNERNFVAELIAKSGTKPLPNGHEQKGGDE